MPCEELIQQKLIEARGHIASGNFRQADFALDDSMIEGLMISPLRDSASDSVRQIAGSAEPFETVRVHDTGRYVKSCRAALRLGNSSAAMESVNRAIERLEWSKL